VDGWGSGRRARPDTRPRRDRPRRGLAQRLRIALVVTSVLVFGLTGTAWGLYRDLAAGITTSDVIAGGRDDGPLDILLVGVDSRTDAQGNPLPPELLAELNSGADTGVLNSDTIILLHVPEGDGHAVGFSIPRDSYVDIPGHGRDKINAAYPATKARAAEDLVAAGVRDPARVEEESAQAGRRALIQAVERLTGVDVDHYAEVNLLGFHELTTAIGGVDVCLNAAVDEPLSGARLPAGRQTIAGADALAFVRQRYGLPAGDLSRIRRQQVFLAAVADKVLSAGTLTDPRALGALMDVARRSLVIDQGWDVLAFASRAAALAAGDLEFVTIPTRGPDTTAQGDVLLVDRGEVREFVRRRIEQAAEAAERAAEGTTQAGAQGAPADPAPASPPAGVDAGRFVVDVRNGTQVSGLAAQVSDGLRADGFVPGTAANAAPAATSVVRYSRPEDEAGARAAAARLGGLPVERSDEARAGRLVVLVGADLAAGTPASAAGSPLDGAREGSGVDAGAPGTPRPPGEQAGAPGVPCID
jgi:LCP family protein required for cell wall assembly